MAMLPVLRVSALNKSFVMHAQGGLALPVLQDVALSVAPGECLALVGPSGAGKSTLLRSLHGNYRPQSGSIQVRHRDSWVELVGAEPRVTLDGRRAGLLLGQLGIPERLWTLPPATFSGGEQQRVNIARSLIADYPVLLLDEPTASLDTANRDGVVDLIRQRREAGAAIVGIFHDVTVRDAVATRLHNVALPGAQP
jgi:alpha-D-ribose 1-methylphosphonate 5-triphosphate synthase subunit PhnL